MALIQCKECGKEISDQAQACPHCGAPVRAATQSAPANVAPKRPLSGASGCLIVIVLVVVFLTIRSCTEEPAPAGVEVSSVQPVASPAATALRDAALAKFTGISLIRHAEWVDDELWLAVSDNGSPWQPVADQACAWMRGQGMTGSLQVKVVDAAALANKRAEQLAYARCN